jgi:TatA/E family protein of Tat protein translocase
MAPVPFPVGQWELLALAIVVALLFGGSQLPAIGRKLGRSVRETRDTLATVDPRTPLRELDRPESTKGPSSEES